MVGEHTAGFLGSREFRRSVGARRFKRAAASDTAGNWKNENTRCKRQADYRGFFLFYALPPYIARERRFPERPPSLCPFPVGERIKEKGKQPNYSARFFSFIESNSTAFSR